MAVANPTDSRVFLTGLARRLISDGHISEEKARDAQVRAIKEGSSLVALLVDAKLVSAARIAESASAEFGLPVFDLSAYEPDPELIKIIGERVIRTHHALPLFKRGRSLFVAVSDPLNVQALDEMKFASGLTTEAIIVEQDKLGRSIEAAMSAVSAASLDVGDADLENIEIKEGGDDEAPGASRADADDAPIVRFVHKILLDAIHQGTSDVHFEPYEKTLRVRYRKDGELRTVASPPVVLAPRIAARLKVMSRLDLAERRMPQDGRIKLYLSKNKAIDFRVSTCPTLWGEKVVCRILDPSSTTVGVEALGFEPEQKEAYLKILARPQGMILVTGPTGSGKTVTLYTGLNILNTDDVNISTAEDPVEMNITGINQVQMHPKVGLTFATALRSFLRQDPDVVMVGEIRDLETAEISIKAAQTGHLVLSTLHTNDAPQTITRLLNIGVPAYNIASSLNLVIAQRLARKLCKFCKRPVQIPHAELIRNGFKPEEVDNLTIYEAVGCDQCDRGYKGRSGIFQVMPFSEAMGRMIMEGGHAQQIADQALRDGVSDLRMSALRKVRDGVIDLLEANRTTISTD
jgi:type IV pilus assembly protein PilB